MFVRHAMRSAAQFFPSPNEPGFHSSAREKSTRPLMHLHPWSKLVSTRPWQHTGRNRKKTLGRYKAVLCSPQKGERVLLMLSVIVAVFLRGYK